MNYYFFRSLKKKQKMYLDFLDGYRGSLAYWVFLHHAKTLGHLDCDYDYFFMTGYYIGVVGFFLLSSYLLTYRLLDELKENGDSNIKIMLIFINYFIRRFFRIYIPYAVICTLVKHVSPLFGGSFKWNQICYFELLKLNPTELTHLWTIPPEIKYYFFIPVLVLITHKISKNITYKIVWILILVVALSIIEVFNLFGNPFENDEYPFQVWNQFLTRFTTFFLGSILALIMNLINDSKIYKHQREKKNFGFTFGTISMVMYIAGMILCSRVFVPSLSDKYFFLISVYWAIFLCTFILGGSNYFTDFFKTKLLYFGGKFSLGIYLYHVGVIDFFFRFYRKTVKLQFEIILYSFICSFVIGFFHYYLFEKKLLQLASLICNFISNLNIFKNRYTLIKNS